jgi:Protein of unknown function (DUF1161)
VRATSRRADKGENEMRAIVMLAALMLVASPALARKDCEELKAEIDAKIKANGVPVYTLEIVPNDQVKDGEGKVVGSCDGGTKKIVYKRG